MKSRLFVTALIGLSLATVGCSRMLSRQVGAAASDAITQSQSAQTASSTKLLSQNGTVQLTVPATWQEVALEESEPNMILRVKSPSDEFQVGIQVFPKAEYPQITREVASMAASDSAKAATGNSSTIHQTPLNQINDLSAVQYESQGEFAGYDVVALSTMVESPKAYYNLLAVGYATDFSKMRDELHQVIQSFQEVQPETVAQ